MTLEEQLAEQAKEYSVWVNKKFREKNRQKIRDKDNERYKTKTQDPEYRQAENDRLRRFRGENPEYSRINSSRRSSAINERLPAWADKSRINEIYRTAAEVSAETGIPHHVDHVIPLRGKEVSGLHHQDNLLIIPGAENLSKSNKFEAGDLPPRAGVRKSRAYLKKIKAAQEAAKRK